MRDWERRRESQEEQTGAERRKRAGERTKKEKEKKERVMGRKGRKREDGEKDEVKCLFACISTIFVKCTVTKYGTWTCNKCLLGEGLNI